MKKYAKEFTISTATQRSPQWYRERAGIPSASGLGALFDTLKDGYTPSAKQKKYLKQLAFERRFGTAFERFDTAAMAAGRYYEDFAKRVYARHTGNGVSEAFSYISSWFIATPDGNVFETATGKRGLLECKVVGDETFMDMMENGMPIEHERQTQSQLMASGFDWVDYIVVNLKTRAYFILRVKRNEKLINRIYERLHEPLDFPELKDIGVKQFDENMLREYVGDAPLLVDADTTIKLLDLPFD